MNIILDSNVLFSALIKKSLVRRLILEYDGLFLFPEYIFDELEEHKGELFKKSKLNVEDFDSLLRLLLRKVVIVPTEALIPYRKEALRIVKDIDKDDVLFVACALAYENSIIWSNDHQLKEQQNRVTVLNTDEIRDIL